MTTIIGTVTLDADMVWSDEYLWNTQHASVQDTLGGGRIVQEFAKSNETGRAITLESLEQQGYQNKTTVDALKSLASQLESIHTLSISHNNKNLTKKVRFKSEENAVQFTPVVNFNGLTLDSMWYQGKILLEVV